MAIIGFFSFFQWKESLLLNGLRQLIVNFSEKEVFFSNSSTGVKLMEYIEWPNQKACERISYFGSHNGGIIFGVSVRYFSTLYKPNFQYPLFKAAIFLRLT